MQLSPPTEKTPTHVDTYAPKPWTPYGLGAKGCLRQIRDAYGVAGLEAPLADAQPVREALFREKNRADITADLENDIRNNSVNLEHSIAAMKRADAVQNILDELKNFESRNALSQAGAMSEQAAADLKSFWAKTNRELKAGAKLLPAEDPLDRDLVFQQDATQAYKRVMTALGTLATLASIYPMEAPRDGGRFRDILYVAKIPKFDTGHAVSHLSNHAKEPLTPLRRGIRNLHKTANQLGRDVALVKVARGDYPGVTLAQPEANDEIVARMESASWALTNTKTDSWGWN